MVWWTAIRWAWRIASNSFYVLVVLYALDQLHGRLENIIVPLLGIIYVSMRTMGTGNAILFGRLAIVIDHMDAKIKKLIDPTHESENTLAENKQNIKTNEWLLYVDLAGLTVISLMCFWRLFVTFTD